MPKISFEEWCNKNNLDINSNSSKRAYIQFRRAYLNQSFIKKLLERKQEQIEVNL